MAVTVVEKPKDIPTYWDWLVREHKIDPISTRSHYNAASHDALRSLQGSQFWTSIGDVIGDWSAEYLLMSKGYELLMSAGVPQLLIKPFDSVVDKSFRKNVLRNERWPEAPDSGWLLPTNWWLRLGDSIRTRFRVKYLDAVAFLSNKILNAAASCAHTCTVEFKARDVGYYAAHANLQYDCSITMPNWRFETITMGVEIQVTTQLQEVILQLTHKDYATTRISQELSVQWQWDYKSEQFVSNYLGHILHYLEGMIMDVRDKQGSTAT